MIVNQSSSYGEPLTSRTVAVLHIGDKNIHLLGRRIFDDMRTSCSMVCTKIMASMKSPFN